MSLIRRLRLPALLAALLPVWACQAADAEEVVDAAPVVEGAASVTQAVASSRARLSEFTYSGQLTQGGWIRGIAPAGAVSVTLGESPVAVRDDGSFFAAFDRDEGASAKLIATKGDGSKVEREIAIAPRAWDIERVNVARRAGGASADFMKRRQPELDRIWNARQIRSGTDGWRQDFTWPVKGRISGRFGSQRIYRGEPGAYHSGLDITTGTSGTPIIAPADGVVVLAATGFSLEGNLLIIDHGMGLNSAFLHLSAIDVAEGERVAQGQQIGRIGASGRATGPHLHWSIKWHEARLDPLLFVDPAA
jgi:murein DD-endopeptidase MepM/ murein hydrolase activator NlpD